MTRRRSRSPYPVCQLCRGTPPGSGSRSATSTGPAPRRRSSAAADSPAGPAPTTTTPALTAPRLRLRLQPGPRSPRAAATPRPRSRTPGTGRSPRASGGAARPGRPGGTGLASASLISPRVTRSQWQTICPYAGSAAIAAASWYGRIPASPMYGITGGEAAKPGPGLQRQPGLLQQVRPRARRCPATRTGRSSGCRPRTRTAARRPPGSGSRNARWRPAAPRRSR